jgi:hypothetical protein
MRAAVGEAISTVPASRLPRLLFRGTEAAAPETAAFPSPEPGLDSPDPRPTVYWLFVPSPQGYSVAEHRSAEPLQRGSPLVLNGLEYRVAVVAPSPFLDGRPCAYLEAPAADAS